MGATDASLPILILGASAGIGALTVDEAVARGLRVRAFARSAEKIPPREGVEAMVGDIREPGDLRRALDGVRGVIYTIGIRERVAMLWEQETLFSESTATLIPLMLEADVKRLVAVTGFGAGRSRQAMSRIEQLGHGAVLGRVYDDKSRQEALIMESALDWTIVRPVILTKGARTGRLKVLEQPKDWRNGLISRKDVAVYLIDAVTKGLHIRQDIVLAR